ncbi:fibronectin type III domain-containing protein [Nocardioides campestrisoli]|uniref:fibronectin type III domain-containing protein n=1 Tax=Nocardioides campestrisoli TaxID=2736757 RepID=UPI00163D6AC4|nr:fibronectin type III domain-containing protein [Nocardioides campestrisoli]
MRGFLRRHRAAIASNTALVVAAGAVLVYAVSADGYRSHRTELNDGGIWVTKSDKGYYGRQNKPIGKLDGAVPTEQDADLDVLQDGAAVIGVNGRSGRLAPIEPGALQLDEGASASLVPGASVTMAGGTLAAVDPKSGTTWAVRYDPQLGGPVAGGLDQQSEPLTEVGEGAALTVTESGALVVSSTEERELVTWRPAADSTMELTEAGTEELPEAAGAPTAMTAVGENVVTLDRAAGTLWVRGGASASVPAGAVLQRPGPAAGSVLVAHESGLVGVDLETGEVATLVDAVSGSPTAPVRLGACTFAAWSGGVGQYASACGGGEHTVSQLDEKGATTNLVFRVNRDQIVLNDVETGSVWDVDADRPLRIDNWEAFTDTKKVEKQQKDDEQQSTGDRRPPQAKPDDFGARAGRTSVLYPLDNDAAPEGRLLAIQGVDQPNMRGARVAISPDRQTLQLTLPQEARGQVSFDYYIDDGRNLKDQATVTVAVRGGQENEAPSLREGYEPRQWRVPAGGSLELPVLPDWRDPRDSDPLMLESARVLSGPPGAVARATTNGRLRVKASGEGGEVQVEYAVSDGLSVPVRRTVGVTVQDKFDQETHPGIAEPDVVSGQVGKPIVIRPLANDLPGSDPGSPNAQLELGGRIPDQAGAKVRTEVNTGLVRVDAAKAGTYLLDYQAAYGNARLARGKIRVDVRPPPKNPEDPVATPDTLTLYGQSSATVDVLANDVDPAGGILVVQDARPDREDQLEVAVVEGRWLKISATQGTLAPSSQVVRYTISNGAVSGVRGEVLVTQRPRPEDNTPVTGPDRVVVRSGQVVAHPVLDNDFSPSGDRLELVASTGEAAGGLEVEAPQDYRGDVGAAYVSGRLIRYVAPAGIEERETFVVPYVAQNSTGETGSGELTVVVVPDDETNNPPEAPALEGRVFAGDTVRLTLPGSGADPDGDPVTITGISAAPRLGRVTESGANSLRYLAFPRSSGTDEFTYTVMDSRGAESTGVVRVAVVPAGLPQPPVAVADSLVVAPGGEARVDVLANDEIGRAKRVTLDLVDPPEGVRLESEIGPLVVPAPASAEADTVEVVYSLSNGLASSLAQVRVEAEDGYNNPPVVQDAFGRAGASDAVKVDLLAGDRERAAAYDPDGPADELRVTRIFAPEDSYQLEGNTVTVTRAEAPMVVPFQVEDADGGVASASLYVPPAAGSRPFVKDGALIEIESGGSTTFSLADHLANPGGGTLQLTGPQQVWTSPRSATSARGTSADQVELTARDDFRGPAAVTVEVMTVEDGEESDPTVLSIPVQVGSDRPEIDCPDSPIDVAASDSVVIDVISVCTVTPVVPGDEYTLAYTVDWADRVEGMGLSADGPLLDVSAAGGVRAGTQAALSVRAANSEPALLRVQVVKAPSPSLLSFSVPDMKPGDSREVNLSRYLRPGVSDADPTILGVRRISGSSVNASSSGPVLRLSAPRNAEGRTELEVEMSDVSTGNPGPERRVTARVGIEVLDTPTTPGPPVAMSIKDRSVKLSWRPSQPRGSRIDHYEVRVVNGPARSQRFRTNGGTFRVPENGKRYSFQVRAHNKSGYSDWSDRSLSAVIDKAPSRVPWIRAEDPGDGTLMLRWGQPRSMASDIQTYYISWRDGSTEVQGSGRSKLISGLDNNSQYDFTIRARNATGISEPRVSGLFQSVGTPASPKGLTLRDLQTGERETALRLDWNGTLPEGPGPTTYTVRATVAGQTVTLPECRQIEATTCRHAGIPYDGRVWSYTVVAQNAPGKTSSPGSPEQFAAVGVPEGWGNWTWDATGVDNQIRLGYQVPLPRGAQSNVTVLVNGVPAGPPTQERGVRSRTVTLPSNTTTHKVVLQLCNEQDKCSTSNPQDAQSYGPLTNEMVRVTPSVVGDSVQWAVQGNSNGNPGKLAIVVYDTSEFDPRVVEQRTVDLGGYGAGQFDYQLPPVKIGWRGASRIDVTLFDDAPGGRGEGSATGTAATPDPPPPSIRIYKVECSDAEGSTNPCGGTGVTQCTGQGCGFVAVEITGFLTPYDCSVMRPGLFDPDIVHTFSRQGNINERTPYFFRSGKVMVECRTTDQGDRVRQEAYVETTW